MLDQLCKLIKEKYGDDERTNYIASCLSMMRFYAIAKFNPEE
jgi:hypothetical protein